MSKSEKFAFGTSFDNVEDLSPGETVYTRQAHQEGVKAGYAEGHQKGLEEGHGDVLQVVQLLSQKLSEFNERYSEDRTRLTEEIIKTSYYMMKTLFPKYSDTYGTQEIEDIVIESLKEREGDRRIEIVVASDVKGPLQEAIEEIKQQGGYFGDIVIRDDPSLNKLDCKLKWDQGGLERLVERVWDEIHKAVSRHVPEEAIETIDQEFVQQENSKSADPASLTAAQEQEEEQSSVEEGAEASVEIKDQEIEAAPSSADTLESQAGTETVGSPPPPQEEVSSETSPEETVVSNVTQETEKGEIS